VRDICPVLQCALSAVTTKGSMESVAAGDVKECTKQSEASDAVASAPRVSFLSASRVPEDEDPVLMSMCKLLTSLLRIPAAGKCLNFPAHKVFCLSACNGILLCLEILL
jgi:hypothetical protein